MHFLTSTCNVVLGFLMQFPSNWNPTWTLYNFETLTSSCNRRFSSITKVSLEYRIGFQLRAIIHQLSRPFWCLDSRKPPHILLGSSATKFPIEWSHSQWGPTFRTLTSKRGLPWIDQWWFGRNGLPQQSQAHTYRSPYPPPPPELTDDIVQRCNMGLKH